MKHWAKMGQETSVKLAKSKCHKIKIFVIFPALMEIEHGLKSVKE